MKIELKLSKDELTLFNNLLQQAYARRFESVHLYNVVHSISLDLADSFDKKFKTRLKKVNLFDGKKKTKITLKYHEAWALKLYLNNELAIAEDTWEHNALMKHVYNLDQQLR